MVIVPLELVISVIGTMIFMKCILCCQTHTDEDADQSVYDVIEKRDNMLENLLVLLNSAAAIGVGPSPSTFKRASASGNRSKSASPMPGSGKGIQRG
jgi:hypothetical protein